MAPEKTPTPEPSAVKRPRRLVRILLFVFPLLIAGTVAFGALHEARRGAETAEGVRGITTALPTDLEGCKVGDRIEARQSGLKLYLIPRPCG